MTFRFRYYIPSQPANINLYVEVVVTAESAHDCVELALSHMVSLGFHQCRLEGVESMSLKKDSLFTS